MSTFITILLFIAVLALLVLAHELGHFLWAKRFGMRVDEFGFGFPPRLWGKKYKGTLYSLNLIPLGGFVRIKGVAGDDDQVEKSTTHEDSFASKPFWKKSIVLFAGIGMNILLGIALLSIVFMIGFPTRSANVAPGGTVSNHRIVVTTVLPDSPAALAQLQAGDIVVGTMEGAFSGIDALKQYLTEHATAPVELTLQRQNEQRTVTVTPQVIDFKGEQIVGIGVGLDEAVIVTYPWYQAFWEGTKMTFSIIGQIFLSLYDILRSVFTRAPVSQEFSGPIGIAVLTGEFARLGSAYFLQFIALLSINLAVFNLLPIPALDGGRIVFTILEKIRHKPVNQKIEAIVHNIGFLLLLMLVLLVTLKDIAKLI